MENQEQSLKLEDTKPMTIRISVEPLATPYRAIVPVDREAIQKDFDVFWATHGKTITEHSNYKGKKQKGGEVDLAKARKALESNHGVSALYKLPMTNYVERTLNEFYAEEGKKVLFINDVKLQNWDDESSDPFLVANLYFWPKLNLNEDFELNYEIQRSIPRDLEGQLKGAIQDLQFRNKFYEETTTDELNEEMEVLIDVIASKKGEPYKEGTIRRHWYRIKDMIVELKDAVLAHKKGDLFETVYPDFKEKDVEVSAHVKIYESRIPHLYDADDPKLYELAKFENKEKFVEKFEIDYNKYMDQSERHIAFDSIVNDLVTNCKLDPIPQTYIDFNVKYHLTQQLQAHKGDLKKLFEANRVKNEEEYQVLLQNQLLKETVLEMAVQAYADKMCVEPDTEVVADHIISQVVWVDPKELPETL